MLNQPSSTITAAFLAGLATALFWAVWNWLEPQAIPPAEVVSLSTTFIVESNRRAGIIGTSG